MEDNLKIKITLVLIISLILYLLKWQILLFLLKSIYFLIYGLNEKLIYVIISITIICLISFAYYFYNSNKNIERLNLVHYLSESEYQLKKKNATDYYINELKKHPRYEEVKEIAEKNHEERMRKTPIKYEQSTDRFSNFLLEDSD